jgi:hypothetical protein
MTVGSRSVVINNLERALSSDINRLQTFKDSSVRELARWMFGVHEEQGEVYPGWITETPASAVDPYQNSVIVNGLMPYPLNGSTTMFVTAGLAFMQDFAATPDQTAFCYVNDPGVQLGGVLVLTPAPGATRIDIIECRLLEGVLEQDNRDIFNPATALFTPALVDKVRAGRLEYRIREGAPGGGFPGVASGWLPLAVVSVPSAAATWDDCTIWDVRPLLSGSHKPPFITWKQDNNTQVFWPSASYAAGGIPPLYCTGKSVVELGPFNQSGIIGNHPTGDPWIDLANAANWANGAVPVADLPYYVWALTPFGLPSWRKYVGAAISPRRPGGMAGVMAVSMVAPTTRGYPSLAIAPPAVTGLGGSTLYGALVACGMINAAGTAGLPFISDGNWVYLGFSSNLIGGDAPILLPGVEAAIAGASTSEYSTVDNVFFPATAKAVRVNVLRYYTCGAALTGLVEWMVFAVDPLSGERMGLVASGSQGVRYEVGGAEFRFSFDLPLAFTHTAVGTRVFEIDYVSTWSTAPISVNEEVTITAWKMTP